MAVYRSPVASQISGSIAGVTYSGNPHSRRIAHAKRTHAVNPSNQQASAQTCLSAAWNRWRFLTPSVRSLWENVAGDRNPANLFVSRYSTLLRYDLAGYLNLPASVVPQPLDDAACIYSFSAERNAATPSQVRVVLHFNFNGLTDVVIQCSKPIPYYRKPRLSDFQNGIIRPRFAFSPLTQFFFGLSTTHQFFIRVRSLQLHNANQQRLTPWIYRTVNP